jgi:hypothetical protein
VLAVSSEKVQLERQDAILPLELGDTSAACVIKLYLKDAGASGCTLRQLLA